MIVIYFILTYGPNYNSLFSNASKSFYILITTHRRKYTHMHLDRLSVSFPPSEHFCSCFYFICNDNLVQTHTRVTVLIRLREEDSFHRDETAATERKSESAFQLLLFGRWMMADNYRCAPNLFRREEEEEEVGGWKEGREHLAYAWRERESIYVIGLRRYEP